MRPLFLLVGATVFAQSPERLTLADAEKRALTNNPSIDAAKLAALAAGEVPAQTRAALQPVLSANLTGAGAPDGTRLGAGALNNPVIYSRVATGISINQLLFDFGRTAKLTESATLQAQAEQVNAESVRAQVALQVRQAYYAALRAQAVLRVAEETVESRELVVAQVQALSDAQLKSGLDLSFAQVSLSEAMLLLASAENQRRAADADLAAAMGESQAVSYELVEEPLPPVTVELRDDLVAQAIQKRPEITYRRLEAEAATQFADAERRLRFPSVGLTGSLGAIPTGVDALRNEYAAVGLNIGLPLLNGGLFKARQAEAQLRARAAQQRTRELQTKIARDVSVAILNLQTALRRVELSRALAEQARRALELAQARYELGLSSIVELSQAQLAQTQADIQQATSRYEYQTQRSVLDFQTGQLLP